MNNPIHKANLKSYLSIFATFLKDKRDLIQLQQRLMRLGIELDKMKSQSDVEKIIDQQEYALGVIKHGQIEIENLLLEINKALEND